MKDKRKKLSSSPNRETNHPFLATERVKRVTSALCVTTLRQHCLPWPRANDIYLLRLHRIACQYSIVCTVLCPMFAGRANLSGVEEQRKGRELQCNPEGGRRGELELAERGREKGGEKQEY